MLRVPRLKLRAYQEEAVEFLSARRGALLADAMGTGKSLSAIAAARQVGGRLLIVCPSYVRGVWWNPTTGGELRKWRTPLDKASGITFLPSGVKRLAPIPEGVETIVIHYDILHAWTSALQEWGPRVVIFDECHALQSDKSLRSKAAKLVTRGASHVWGLSGTPLTNRPKDLWNVLDTLVPGRFGGFFRYALRYCDACQVQVTPTKRVWKFDGKSNLAELGERLEPVMLRRTASDVALQLPSKTRQMVHVDVPAKARLSSKQPSQAELRRLLDAAADAKLPEALALVLGHLQEGAKVVAFTHRRSVAEWLCDSLRESGCAAELVHGGISALRRGAAIERAKLAPGGVAMVATVDSSSTGIDLSFASVAVFVELSWQPHTLLQAEARLHRYGQVAPVLIQYVIANGTTDELVVNVVVGKLDTFAQTIGETGETLDADLKGSEDDILGELYTAIGKSQARSR